MRLLTTVLCVTGVLGRTLSSTSSDASPAPLGAYNVDPASVSVSGLSSGGSFTIQLGIAYSRVFQTGFGVFAGQPYDCARNQSFHLCSDNRVPNITIPNQHLAAWNGDQVDPLSALMNRKVYLEVGSADRVVGPNVMAAVQSQLSPYTAKANMTFVTIDGAAHTFPTNLNRSADSPCNVTQSPYVSNCGYDGAGAVLQWMYGNLKARNDGTLGGKILSYAQNGTFGTKGMADTGYVYVPAACAGGATRCRLHVAMHGCSQSVTDVGMDFVQGTGYNLWADTNNIIVMYPQTVPDNTTYTIFDGVQLSNEPGCWDWLGFYGLNCDQKGGSQMSAVVAQVHQVISGYH